MVKQLGLLMKNLKKLRKKCSNAVCHLLEWYFEVKYLLHFEFSDDAIDLDTDHVDSII